MRVACVRGLARREESLACRGGHFRDLGGFGLLHSWVPPTPNLRGRAVKDSTLRALAQVASAPRGFARRFIATIERAADPFITVCAQVGR
jgi:hypothetical protein